MTEGTWGPKTRVGACKRQARGVARAALLRSNLHHSTCADSFARPPDLVPAGGAASAPRTARLRGFIAAEWCQAPQLPRPPVPVDGRVARCDHGPTSNVVRVGNTQKASRRSGDQETSFPIPQVRPPTDRQSRPNRTEQAGRRPVPNPSPEHRPEAKRWAPSRPYWHTIICKWIFPWCSGKIGHLQTGPAGPPNPPQGLTITKRSL